ncbi:tumor protein p63-regulated gene 1-like protein [Ambystoma mexicanum]|uniref:tumor protein p63-regulated gene 1-like protein n=1 Tax=Ambystoma mexicanum TaxID=8296 RepID=UPI0037E771FD
MEEVKTVSGELREQPPGPSALTAPGEAGPEPHAHLYPKEPRVGYTPSALEPAPRRTRNGADYFILRAALLDQAIKDMTNLLSPADDGAVQSVWILTEVTHWNQDQERLALLTERTLLLCQYDFVGLSSSQLFRVPLNFIDTVFWGPFTYPSTSLNKREGHALRIQWDKLRQPSFLSRWNPWASDLPYLTLTEHPAAGIEEKVAHMCQLGKFKEQLVEQVRTAHAENPLPGRANGLLVLEQPVTVDTYLGLLSLISSKAEMGYSKSRGLFGF